MFSLSLWGVGGRGGGGWGWGLWGFSLWGLPPCGDPSDQMIPGWNRYVAKPPPLPAEVLEGGPHRRGACLPTCLQRPRVGGCVHHTCTYMHTHSSETWDCPSLEHKGDSVKTLSESTELWDSQSREGRAGSLRCMPFSRMPWMAWHRNHLQEPSPKTPSRYVSAHVPVPRRKHSS